MKKISMLILALLMVVSLVACDNTEDTKTPDATLPDGESVFYAQQNYKLAEVADRLKLMGRATVASNGIACDLTATGIEFNAFIEDQFSFTVNCSKDTYFTVFVDGQRLEERFEAKGNFVDCEIVVENLGEMTLRNICIVKQTESQLSVATLKNVAFYGALASKPAKNDLYIEFLGDSITSGYGNLWTKNAADPSSASGTALYQDGTKSFAFLTAQLLQADVSIVSCSGIGVDRGFTNQDGNGYRMMDFYIAASYHRSKTDAYDFENARVPDAVVINLGTNDQSLGSTEEAFKAGVRELVESIRTSYGEDVPVVWVYGMMADGCYQWTESVLNDMGGSTAKLYMFELVRNKEGGNGHPSEVAQKIASQQLTGFLVNNGII